MSIQKVHRKNLDDNRVKGKLLTFKDAAQAIDPYKSKYQDGINKFYKSCKDKLVVHTLTELGDDVIDKLEEQGIIREIYEETYKGLGWYDVRKFNLCCFYYWMNPEHSKETFFEEFDVTNSKNFTKWYFENASNEELEEFRKQQREDSGRWDLKKLDKSDLKEFKRLYLRNLVIFEEEHIRNLNRLDPEWFKKWYVKSFEVEARDEKLTEGPKKVKLIDEFVSRFVRLGKQVLNRLGEQDFSNQEVLDLLFSEFVLTSVADQHIMVEELIREVDDEKESLEQLVSICLYLYDVDKESRLPEVITRLNLAIQRLEEQGIDHEFNKLMTRDYLSLSSVYLILLVPPKMMKEIDEEKYIQMTYRILYLFHRESEFIDERARPFFTFAIWCLERVGTVLTERDNEYLKGKGVTSPDADWWWNYNRRISMVNRLREVSKSKEEGDEVTEMISNELRCLIKGNVDQAWELYNQKNLSMSGYEPNLSHDDFERQLLEKVEVGYTDEEASRCRERYVEACAEVMNEFQGEVDEYSTEDELKVSTGTRLEMEVQVAVEEAEAGIDAEVDELETEVQPTKSKAKVKEVKTKKKAVKKKDKLRMNPQEMTELEAKVGFMSKGSTELLTVQFMVKFVLLFMIVMVVALNFKQLSTFLRRMLGLEDTSDEDVEESLEVRY